MVLVNPSCKYAPRVRTNNYVCVFLPHVLEAYANYWALVTRMTTLKAMREPDVDLEIGQHLGQHYSRFGSGRLFLHAYYEQCTCRVPCTDVSYDILQVRRLALFALVVLVGLTRVHAACLVPMFLGISYK